MRATPILMVASLALIAAAPQPPALLLNGRNLDPALLLPAPPKDDTPAGRAELAELHRIDATRTPAEIDHARADDKVKDVTVFAAIMGPGFVLTRLPATRRLFDTVRVEEKAAADRAKTHFLRNRPWITDPSVHACSTEDEPQSSYPSGHTTMGYAMGAVLARLAPDRATAIMARAADYAHGRLICEVHFPSDVVGGQVFGMIIAEKLMEQPSFRVQFEAAQAELARQGLIRASAG